MKYPYLLTAMVVMCAGIAAAHTGVKNANVMARMDGMSAIGADLKTLGLMAKGSTAFDADTARAAARSIESHAGETPDLFREEEGDPKSEAKPGIWLNFEDFTSRAAELEEVARGLSKSISRPEDLAPAMAALGETCTSCHRLYREKGQ